MLDMSKIHLPAKLWSSSIGLCNLAVISIQTGFQEERLTLTLFYYLFMQIFLQNLGE